MASFLKVLNLGHSGKKATKFEFAITFKELMVECNPKRFAFILLYLIIIFYYIIFSGNVLRVFL